MIEKEVFLEISIYNEMHNNENVRMHRVLVIYIVNTKYFAYQVFNAAAHLHAPRYLQPITIATGRYV